MIGVRWQLPERVHHQFFGGWSAWAAALLNAITKAAAMIFLAMIRHSF